MVSLLFALLGGLIFFTGGIFQAIPNDNDNQFHVFWEVSQEAYVGIAFFLSYFFLSISRRRKIEEFAKKNAKKIFLLLIGWQVIAWFLTSVSSHLNFHTKGWDLGIYDQAIWSVWQKGVPLLWSSIRGDFQLLGDHFEPILIPLSVFSFLSPYSLLIVQASCLGLFCYFLLKQAKTNFQFAVLLGCLFSLAFNRGNRADFHSVVLAVPCFALLVHALRRNIFWNAMLFSLLIVLVKENLIVTVGFVWLGFGVRPIRWNYLISSLFFFALFVLVLKVVIPSFAPDGVYSYFQDSKRMGGHCLGLMDCATHLLFDPHTIKTYLFQGDKWLDLFKMLLPLGFCILTPQLFPAILWEIFLNLVDHKATGFQAHYGLIPFSLLTLATFYAPIQVPRRFLPYVFLWPLLFSAKVEMFYARAYGFLQFSKVKEFHEVEIPQDAVIWASPNVVPHLSHRAYIYEYPYDVKRPVDYVILQYPGHGMTMDEERFNRLLSELQTKGFIQSHQAGNWWWLRRTGI